MLHAVVVLAIWGPPAFTKLRFGDVAMFTQP